MNILKFSSQFPDENACIEHFKAQRDAAHHKLTKEYLQYYLNEFCYKFNRRYYGEQIFDRLIVEAVSYNTDFKSKIYNRALCG